MKTAFILFSALIAADFITGVLHFIEDRYGDSSWPDWLYQRIVYPNIRHHVAPREMLNGGWWSRVQDSAMICMAIGAAILLMGKMNLFWFAFLLISSQANEIHGWAHRGAREKPWPIKAMQWTGLFQSTSHHRLHHLRPNDSHFCVITCYVNPVLERVRFWSALETVFPPSAERVTR